MCPTCFHLGAVRNSSQEDVKLFLFLRATQFCDGIILKDIILPAIFCVIKLRKCGSHTYAPVFGSTYNIYIYGCSRVYKYIHVHNITHVQKRAPFAGMLRARPAWIVAPVVPWWKEKRTGSLSSSG